MKKSNIFKKAALLGLSIFTQISVFAQFTPPQPVIQPAGMPLWTINAQVRPRGEVRHGLANPIDAATPAQAFISQRTNLNLGFRWDKMTFNVDVRDVRVWGQDASSISNADGNKLFLHQGWGEFILATTADTNCKLKIDNLSLKVGRQEIAYDDARLLGNLDWLQQGRRHDAAILKFMHRGYQADLGFAFNQNTDAFSTAATPKTSYSQYNGVNGYANNLVNIQANGLPVVVPGVNAASTNALWNNYKMFQYLYLARRFNQTRVSALFFKDDFQKYDNVFVISSATGTNVNTGGTREYRSNNATKSRYTVGIQFSTQIGNSSEGWKTAIAGGAYGQFGQDPRVAETTRNRQPNGQLGNPVAPTAPNLNAAHFFGHLTFSKDKWSFGPGFDVLTGNTTRITENKALGTAVSESVGTENNRFDPLYGTPHRWWGYMDYFYVGTGSPTAGLTNLYFKAKYTENKWFISADFHHFMTAGKQIWYRTSTTDAFKELGMNYGQELDLIFNYQANKFTNVEFGYSVMLATDALAASKGYRIGNTDAFNQWAYLMINIRPDFLYQKPVAIKN